LKARLARELSRLTFERWRKQGTVQNSKFKSSTGKTIFGNSGFEAVEAALKTAVLATGKNGVIAFTGAYHGLGYGALNATHREHFRERFQSQLGAFGHFAPFPSCGSCQCKPKRGSKECGQLHDIESSLREIFYRQKIGAVLVEPVQARGGINIPDRKFLPLLRRLCDEHDALLILDEIYTGFGRTGAWFACEHSRVIPDLICLGKALTGGFPLSACVGRAEIMDRAWPLSNGEAIHTSTFLGHPVGCAMALAQLKELQTRRLPERSKAFGTYLLDQLRTLEVGADYQVLVRGIGLMAGVELRHHDDSPAMLEALGIIKRLLHRGFILLPEGEHGNVISFTPPLTISKPQLRRAVRALQTELFNLTPS
ncbi:MAG: aspartate aminotransferase family protein, partial [Opitutaceae bacterium]|nr:aspartate aminotransferase family protein [Verrucomicrobiales bacterium]